MEINTLENLIKAKCMGKVFTNMQMVKATMVNGSMERDKEKVNGGARKI